MINTIGTIANIIIAVCALFLSYVAGREPLSHWIGIKNFYIDFYFAPDHDIRQGSAFCFYIYNKGITPQIYRYIKNERGRPIVLYAPGGGYRKMKPREAKHFCIYLTPSFIKTLEKSKSLFLVNHLNKRKKFASKKDIQRELKKYREHIDKKS